MIVLHSVNSIPRVYYFFVYPLHIAWVFPAQFLHHTTCNCDQSETIMEQQKGSFKYSENQDRQAVAVPNTRANAAREEGQGVVTHSNPKSRDDNRNSKGQEADREPRD